MGTLADKLNKTLDTKNRIASAIEEMSGKNPGAVFADYPNAIRAIPTGGGGWTGHADVEGLKAIGWDDEDIAYYQEHGVNWNEEDDQYHLVPEDNKALYGAINIGNIQDYKDILVYLPKIDTTGVTSMANKFQNCYSLVAIPLIDMSGVTEMSAAFNNCYSLVCLPKIDTSNVTRMVNTFNGCYALVFMPDLNLSSIENMQQAFSSCYSLTTVKVAGSLIQNTYFMLSNCSALAFVEMDVSKVSNMGIMFSGCKSVRWCQLYGLTQSISISSSSLLEKSSLIYMIENAAPTDAITITLSAYCYNKYSNDPDVVAALSAQPLVSLASA
nr:MAG TPA: hypothetical protein [Caudoviricetes sp.]